MVIDADLGVFFVVVLAGDVNLQRHGRNRGRDSGVRNQESRINSPNHIGVARTWERVIDERVGSRGWRVFFRQTVKRAEISRTETRRQPLFKHVENQRA
jgi:hypothetical protein